MELELNRFEVAHVEGHNPLLKPLILSKEVGELEIRLVVFGHVYLTGKEEIGFLLHGEAEVKVVFIENGQEISELGNGFQIDERGNAGNVLDVDDSIELVGANFGHELDELCEEEEVVLFEGNDAQEEAVVLGLDFFLFDLFVEPDEVVGEVEKQFGFHQIRSQLEFVPRVLLEGKGFQV